MDTPAKVVSGEDHCEVELFASVFCPYCHVARRLLRHRGIRYRYREVPMLLGFKLPLPVYREMKRRSGGETTVPQIFVNGRHYGDEDTLKSDERAGKLDTIFRCR